MHEGDRVRIRQIIAGEQVRESFTEGTITQMAGQGWVVVHEDGGISGTWRLDELEPVALTADEAATPQVFWQKGDRVRNIRTDLVGTVIASSLSAVTVRIPDSAGFRTWPCALVKPAR